LHKRALARFLSLGRHDHAGQRLKIEINACLTLLVAVWLLGGSGDFCPDAGKSSAALFFSRVFRSIGFKAL
jgi:hypothetical protein